MQNAPGTRVIIDYDLCEGHGMCEDILPDVFRVNDDGKVDLLRDTLADHEMDKAREAVKYCPTDAIRLAADAG